MESSVVDLSKYRLQRSKENLKDAWILLDAQSYKSSVNRSYYSIFHCLRAVTALDGFDSSKHSGIIAFFNMHYVKNGVFGKEMSKILDKAYRWREKADYKDYEEVTKAIAEEQLVNAEKFLAIIEPFLQEKWTNG
ncbi:MAG: HEPN domain-containing protein [Phascolarctobacterium sp.]|nr:HEPN domain-containing protein [Phascolarctobacterium sp.]